MSEQRDIEEQLREQAMRRSGGPKIEATHTKMLEWKAADEITSLREALEEEQANAARAWRAWETLTAQLASARKALARMSEQLLSSQMDEDQRDHADWQGGYDAMVIAARAAKAALTDEQGTSK